MRGKWPFALAIIIISLAFFSACRKHHIGQSDTPVIPRNDSVPGNDTVPGPPKYNQIAVHHSINSNVGGFYEALPPAYDSTDKKYPLLLFLHGGGELGDGNGQLPLILKNSVTRRLAEKTFPVSFTVNGEEFSFKNIEFNFIQLIFYPSRLAARKDFNKTLK